MTKKRRMLVLAAVLVFVMLFSVLFIVFEADHDCHGEDCIVCAQISICLNIFRDLLPALSLLAAAAWLLVSAAEFLDHYSCALKNISLISLKVKLSD